MNQQSPVIPADPACAAPASRATDDTPLLFKPELAATEGWNVFDCGFREDGSPRIEIKLAGSPNGAAPMFLDDDIDAWRHVVARARAGSALHQRTLRMIDPVERMLIEASFGWWPEPPIF